MSRQLLALTALALMSAPALAQGPVVLMGIDAEDGNINFGNHGGTTPYIDVIDNGILPNVNNGGSGILVIGGGKSPTDDVTLFWDAVGAGVGEAVTYANGAAAIGAQSFAGFAVVAVASSVFETGSGGLTNAENDAFTTRAADVADHVNGGGGLFCTSQEGLTTPYGYLGSVGAFTFNFPAQFDQVTATVEGEAVGITDTNLDVCCWHDEYVTFPGFLDVLATNDATGTPCALGGNEVIIVQGIVLTPAFAQNFVGEDHTVTATVADNMGNPVVGTTVDFEVIAGPNVGTMGSDVTDANGQAFFTYSSLVVGVDTIEGCFTDNMMVVQCDQVTKEWIALPCVTLDFETDDCGAPLPHGRNLVTVGPECPFTCPTVTGGPDGVPADNGNAGAAIFDSTNGPFGQDPDLGVGQGNVLYLQNNDSATTLEDINPADDNWDHPNDDSDGGTLSFDFCSGVEPISIDLIDVDFPAPDNDSSVVLTDVNGLTRTYAVPAGWTADGPGAGSVGTLLLNAVGPQPGLFAVATESTQAGFSPTSVIQVKVRLGSSGAVDDLTWCETGVPLPEARATARNGFDVNPMTLASAAAPRLGEAWAADLDCSAHSNGLALLFLWSQPRNGPVLSIGQILIAGPRYLNLATLHFGSVAGFTQDIPFDVALVGMSICTQGLCFGSPGPQLSNAVDIVLGF